LLKRNPFDILFLDLHMTGIDGLTLMRRVREHWPEIKIIIITAYPSLDSAIDAVHFGVFDYLRKPCSFDDIVTSANRALVEKSKLDRQRQLLQQAEANLSPGEGQPTATPAPIVKSGALVIEMGPRTAALAGERLPLTPTEYGLLEILAKSPGQAVPIAQLVQEGLGYATNDPQAQETLRVHISRLRRKLGVDYILTIRGGGYALAVISPVQPPHLPF
jgi:DNA-binding response OmpR family regulator